MVFVAILAAGIVASLTVDLGPSARSAAEREGSKYIERPMRIGRLSIHVLTGKFVVEDLTIDGLQAGDRPFFTARRIAIAMDWTTAMQRRPEFLITSVEMTDWSMLVEKWEGRHNFPKFTRDNPSQGPRRFTSTLKHLRAHRGQFTYEDHQSPWSIVCPNLDFTLGNVPNYNGEAVFTGGTVQIQNYKPMWANMRARFVIDGSHVELPRIEFDTDGAKTIARGSVEMGRRWPEQSYDFESQVQFPRMNEIFFAGQNWDLTGDGDVEGKFSLFKGGHDLRATFTSPVLGWNEYRFPDLSGDLHWTPKAFDVTNAAARFFGGDADFTYSIKPLGGTARSTSRFEASYVNADLAQFSDFQGWQGLRLAGAWSGHNLLEWPTGRFVERVDEGTATVVPPTGVEPVTGSFAAGRGPERSKYEWGPFAPVPLPTHVPIAADVTYRFTADELELQPSYFATEGTHVAFQGDTAWGERSRFAFHVTSEDWQESDLVLAGLIRDFGSTSDARVAIGGRGEFDGVMTGPFRRARVEGTFSGENLRAWDTTWGDGTGEIVYENDYLKVSNAIVRLDDSEIRADGLFSLATPREDGGDEIDARFTVMRRDLDSLRHAFQIDEYPLSGRMTGEFRLKGERGRPMGTGSMTIDDGVAYGEPIQKATASLRFDGLGVRLDAIEIAKGEGTITGAAFIGWDSTYSFNVDGRRIAAGSVALISYPGTPVSGTVELSASGNGTFDEPRNDYKIRISDLAVAGDAVGVVTGELALRGTDLSGQVDAASPRLSMTGTGRISLDPEGDSEISLRFNDSSIDQYVRLFVPKLSPSTTAVVSGAIRVAGDLTDLASLAAEGTIDTIDMRLFDYSLRNAAPIRLSLGQGQVSVRDLQLVGDDTRLRVAGTVGLVDDRIGLRVTGDANLGILQGFFRDVRGSGRAELTAAVDGALRQPVFSGSAMIAEGRIRHFSLPNALDAINGTVAFDEGGVRLDDLSATMGGGRVQFGGRIGFDGYLPGDLNVTVRGENMQLRLLEGLRSTFDADLALVGSYQAPTLSGAVMVKNALWTRRIDAPGSIFDFARGASGGGSVIVGEPPATFPLRYDVRIEVPSTLRVDTNLLRLVASADLTLQGSYDRPVIAGHADIERGDVNFEGRRYRITRGAIDFNNPTRTEPFFDIEAETNVRVPGPPVQTYHINVGFAGTADRLQPTVSSDPALPTADVLALLFSDVRRNNQQDVELRALQNPNQAQTDILAARATQALTAPISAEVGKVVEEAFGVDTFQLTPSFVDPSGQQSSGLNPTARLTIGKRVSDRVYLTFSRSLGTTINDQIVLLEYEESDRLSWILSRNEDQQTYALEFRVRHTF
jgi:autotransporter translocation and assembly factor TamB